MLGVLGDFKEQLEDVWESHGERRSEVLRRKSVFMQESEGHRINEVGEAS